MNTAGLFTWSRKGQFASVDEDRLWRGGKLAYHTHTRYVIIINSRSLQCLNCKSWAIGTALESGIASGRIDYREQIERITAHLAPIPHLMRYHLRCADVSDEVST